MPPDSLSFVAGVRSGGGPVLAPVPQVPVRSGRERSRRAPRVRRDVLFWTGCAAFALSLALVTTLTPHRIWGLCAAVGYAVAAQLARRSPRPWGERGAVAALIGSVVPLTLMIAAGAAQSEVQVVEHSGALLLDSGSPYVPHPAGVDDYNPYLPGMAIFGIPHTLFGGTPLADARVWFCGVFLASMLVAARRADLNRLLRGGISGGTASGRAASSGGNSSGGKASPNAVLLLASFPAVALPLAVGGVDLPVIGLMCLGLALAGRGGSGTAAGLAMGAAAALKWTAWPLLPVGLVLLAATAGAAVGDTGRSRRRTGGRPGRGAGGLGRSACLRRARGALPARRGRGALTGGQPAAGVPAGHVRPRRIRPGHGRARGRRGRGRGVVGGTSAQDRHCGCGPAGTRAGAGDVPDPGDAVRVPGLSAGAGCLVP